MPVLEDHGWPAPGEHLFGPWQAKSRTHQYRVCLHPKCSHVEEREAPKERAR